MTHCAYAGHQTGSSWDCPLGAERQVKWSSLIWFFAAEPQVVDCDRTVIPPALALGRNPILKGCMTHRKVVEQHF